MMAEPYPSYSQHRADQIAALAALTFTQWFAGRGEYTHQYRPRARDLGEQAMRADYIADKAWWYVRYEAETYPTLAAATAAAAAELPEPAPSARVVPPAWADRLDADITAAATHLPSRQWATTVVPIPDQP